MTKPETPIDLGALHAEVVAARDELYEVGHALRVLSTWVRHASDRADAALDRADAAVARLEGKEP